MMLIDEQRRYVDVNGAYLHLVGYKREALLGRPVPDFLEPGTAMSPQEWRAALSRPHFSSVARLVCADGKRVAVEFAGHPEDITGERLVLAVALRTSRGGRPVGDNVTAPARGGELSEREREVVRLLAHGASGPDIAEELHVTHNTVRTHVRNAMTKLGAHSRAQLVAMSLATAAQPD